MTYVPPRGPQPALFMIVGEAPGKDEAAAGRPFVGKSGQEQEWYLSQHDMNSFSARVTNVVPDYTEGNPDPTVAQIREWTPVLLDEVVTTQPKLIVAVGRFAARWFLGDDLEMETVHGIPHRAGAFDNTRWDRAAGAIVLPIYHPAMGLYDPEARAVIAWDYSRVAAAVKSLKAGRELHVRRDNYAGYEDYREATGQEIADAVGDADAIAIDTEGSPDAPWSLQISVQPGQGLVLAHWRPSLREFLIGARAIQRAADRGATIVLHNGMFDVEMCRAMGIELGRARLWDTMYAAYLLRLEPQGLKPLAWRWCGMKMQSYQETVGTAGAEKQAAYLVEAVQREWPAPEPQVLVKNDGTARLYTPQGIVKRVTKILADTAEGEVDFAARWKMIPKSMRAQVEEELGPFPVSGLGDIPLERAIYYAARDADATLRLYLELKPELARLDLTRTLDDGMEVLPVFEEMQATGMTASRVKFAALTEQVEEEMAKIQAQLSHRYYQGKPFNPGSTDQVRSLLRRRDLEGMKRTTSGMVSTGKKSIEHLRFTDPAIALVMDWREHAKIRDAFCLPILERIPEEEDLYPIRCKIKTTRVTTRRLAAEDPNLLQIPTRHALGRAVRDCYVAPPGELYGAWDLSQIEMRFMAHESEDPLLCELFRSGRDVHAETAAAVFKIPLAEVDDKKHRYPAKRAGFGILYGISGGGLYDQLRMMSKTGFEDWSAEKCDELIARWLEVYGGVAEYIQRTSREVKKTGIVRDHWGMMRYLPGIWSRDLKTAAESGRFAVSHKIQGGAQGMIQRSIAWLKREIWDLQDAGLNVHWCLQIHDEVILRFDADLADLVNDLALEALTRHCGIELRVPVKASGNVAASWGKLK